MMVLILEQKRLSSNVQRTGVQLRGGAGRVKASPVGDGQHRPVLELLPDGPLQQRVRPLIHARRGFIDAQDLHTNTAFDGERLRFVTFLHRILRRDANVLEMNLSLVIYAENHS